MGSNRGKRGVMVGTTGPSSRPGEPSIPPAGGKMEHTPTTTMRQRDLSVWPRYDAAVLGFRNYWYPVTWSRRIGSKPYPFRLLGEPIMFYREQRKVYAFYD